MEPDLAYYPKSAKKETLFAPYEKFLILSRENPYACLKKKI